MMPSTRPASLVPLRAGILALASMVVVLASVDAEAADVTLKDGTHVSGDVVEEQPTYVVIRTADSTRMINASLVAGIDRTKDVPEAAEGTHVSDVIGGRDGTHFGVTGGLVVSPQGSSSMTAGAIGVTLGARWGTGEVDALAAYFNGSINSTGVSGGLVIAEYRLFFLEHYGLGLGPLVGIGSSAGTTTKVIGFQSTPVVLRLDHFDLSLSFFFMHGTDNGSGDVQGFDVLGTYAF